MKRTTLILSCLLLLCTLTIALVINANFERDRRIAHQKEAQARAEAAHAEAVQRQVDEYKARLDAEHAAVQERNAEIVRKMRHQMVMSLIKSGLSSDEAYRRVKQHEDQQAFMSR